MGLTASHMYLVITTAIWMNETKDQSNNARNVPFGVLGVMLPYKTVRSTHYSDLCVFILPEKSPLKFQKLLFFREN